MKVLEFQNVGKKYQIHRRRQLLAQQAFRLVSRDTEPFWALRNVTFTLEAGERVAVIGPNGAGKSTLLSIVTGVTSPSEGDVVRRGTVSGLLELGSGFHTDLTGRENVHLNASLLGLNREQVNERMEEIIAFSGLDRFIDETLRTYSSGMVARLAFAVAVNVDPDVLVLDEVLAVGDQAFARRCMKKMHEYAERGKTLLFVSHGVQNVLDLCQRAIWLDEGTIKRDGDVGSVVEEYSVSIA